jgi:beta-phosphoglucomutase-like phosphatase (HAD superfamily)
MTDKKTASPETSPAPSAPPGVLIDLETLVQDSRKLQWACLSKRLKKAAEKNGTRAFYSAGLSGAPAQFGVAVAQVCGLEAGPAKIAADAAAEDLIAAYAKKGQVAAPGAAALAKKAAAVVAITWMPEETAQALLTSIGLQDAGIRLFCVEAGTGAFPDEETWLRAARSEGGSVGAFVAVVSGETACRSALAAGFRCLSVPDEYTTFQDFSGARGVFDTLSEVPAALGGLIA